MTPADISAALAPYGAILGTDGRIIRNGRAFSVYMRSIARAAIAKAEGSGL